MKAFLSCGPCGGEGFPVGANVVDMRKVAGLRLVSAACPGCGLEVTVRTDRRTFEALWGLWCRWVRDEDRLVAGLRGELEAAGAAAAELIGRGEGAR